MKRFITILISCLLILSFTGCICTAVTSALLSGIQSSTTNEYTNKINNGDKTDNTIINNTSTPQNVQNGSNEKVYRSYQQGYYIFQIPSYYFEQEVEDNGVIFAASSSNTENIDTFFFLANGSVDFTKEEYNVNTSAITDYVLETFNIIDAKNLLTESVTISGITGVKAKGNGSLDGTKITFLLVHLFDSSRNNIIFYLFVQNESSSNEYASDAEAIIHSMKIDRSVTNAPITTPKATKKPTPTPKPTMQTRNGIRPEFQKAMDEYLQFFTEYCNFIKKYTQSPDVSMALQYLEFMQHYAETMEALESIDEKELSSEELKLYLDTTNKINKMLIDLSTGL
ncbi:MAG: hypothetical protein IJK54_11030 [Clostridia bacterium]|nr:hypothetical protein [Clostridia bacterium]